MWRGAPEGIPSSACQHESGLYHLIKLEDFECNPTRIEKLRDSKGAIDYAGPLLNQSKVTLRTWYQVAWALAGLGSWPSVDIAAWASGNSPGSKHVPRRTVPLEWAPEQFGRIVPHILCKFPSLVPDAHKWGLLRISDWNNNTTTAACTTTRRPRPLVRPTHPPPDQSAFLPKHPGLMVGSNMVSFPNGDALNKNIFKHCVVTADFVPGPASYTQTSPGEKLRNR